MNMTLKGALAFTVVSSLLLCLQAGGAPHLPAASPPIASELQLLQGTWEGIVVGDKGTSKNPDLQKTSERKPGEIDLDFLKPGVFETPPQSHEKITITITGNSFHFHRDTNFWFDTTITLPVGKDPKQLHATIKGGPPSQASSIGQVVRAFFKIVDGTLTLAAIGGAEETPEGFEAAVENRYELRKVQPQKKNTNHPKPNEPETPNNARCSEPGHRAPVAIIASRAPGR
jgi:hypothetical protein